MARAALRRTLLAILATDRTFELREARGGEPVWVGRCIHCNRPLQVRADGEPGPGVTIEHIVPRAHGGDDTIENLAIACSGCNHAKGRRQDPRGPGDPGYERMIGFLKNRRLERWRDPGTLPS